MKKIYYCGLPHKKKKIERNRWRHLLSLFLMIVLFGFISNRTYGQGQTCNAPIIITSLPYNDNGNTSAYGDNYDNADVPPVATGAVTNGTGSDYYITGDDVVYQITPSINGTLSVSTTNDDDWIGLWVFEGCPFASTVGYHTATSGTTRNISNIPVQAGNDYFIVISTWDAPQSTNYTIDVTGSPGLLVPPSCMFVSNLTLDNLAPNNDADISWTAGGSETTWNISWGPAGYTPGDINEVGNEMGWTTGTNYTITGLNFNTTYDVYVQADCGGGDESIWRLLSITTPCSFVTPPWLYDVETATATTSSEIEDCWSSDPNNTTSSYRWDVEGSGGGTPSTSTGPDAPYSGSSYFYVEATSGSTGDSAFLVTPPIDISGLTLPFLKFYYHMYGADIDNMVVQITDDGGATWSTETTITGQQQLSGSDPWMEYSLPFVNTYSGQVQVRFVAVRGGGYEGDIAIDDIEVKESPTCLHVNDLLVAPIGGDSATVSWTAGGSEGNWNIVWGPPGFTPGDTNQIGSATSSNPQYTIHGLTPGTDYAVYVQADCGGGDESIWEGPIDFQNYYCVPGANTSSYYIDEVSTVGALTNLNNIGSGADPNGYGDYTATDTLVVYPGQILDFTIVSGYGTQYYYVYVDWFQNANFDDPIDLIESTSSYSSDHTFTYTIPPVPEMTTRLRVRASGSGSAGGPCNQNNYTETEDYIIKVVAAPTCLPPINLDSLDATTTSIQLGWDEQNSATTWSIEYGPTGFTPGTGTVISGVNTNPYTVSGLDPSTTYDFYVQSDCGGGDESYWGGPVTIPTQCGVTPAPFYEGFSTGELPICWTNVSSNTTSTSSNNFWSFDESGGYGASGNGGKAEGTFAMSDGSSPYPDSMMLITPEIDLSTLTNPALSFEWFSNNTNYPGDNVPLIVLVTKDNINWITLDTLQGDDLDWQFASYDLNAYANDTIRVIFMTNQTVTTNLSQYNDILLDEVRIDDCINGQPGSKDVCRLDGTINLNDNIIVPPNGGGKWYGGTALSSLITNDSILDVTSLPAGSYEVYYSERTVCFDTTIATIDVYGPSSAGDGTTIHACKYDPLNLFSTLTGTVDMGGDWYDYNGNLLPNSQPTAPGIQASYNYKYITSNGVCPADTATVEVVIDDCEAGLEEEAFTNISVYPNPATNQINIMNPSTASDLKVEVLDVNGRVVLVDNDVMKNTSKATIAIDQLAKGIYTLRVYNDEGQKVFKVVKQ